MDNKEDAVEALGLLIDRLDNVAGALDLPIPDDIHVTALKGSLPEIVQEFKDLFAAVTGEPSPWDC